MNTKDEVFTKIRARFGANSLPPSAKGADSKVSVNAYCEVLHEHGLMSYSGKKHPVPGQKKMRMITPLGKSARVKFL